MQPEEKTLLCEKCQKQINANNFMIHEAMCRGSRESFVLGGLTKLKSKESKMELDKVMEQEIIDYPNFEEGEKKQQKKQKKEEYPKLYEPERKHNIFVNPNVQNKNIKPKVEQKFQPKKSEVQQRFRCTDCGYMMTMAQLDSHPNQCPAQYKKCQFCGIEFPHYLMEMHLEVCEKSSSNQQHQRRSSVQRQHIRQQLNRRQREDQEHRSRVRPARGIREGNIPPNIVPVSTQTFITNEGNNRVMIRRVQDQNGRIYEERIRQPVQEEQEQQQDEGYHIIIPISIGGGGGLNSNDLNHLFFGGGGFQQVIRRLMTNMNINRQQNPGMTKQQISKIPVTKYDPATNPKSTSCTVCVTDLQKNDKVMKLKCGHLFHPQCLVPWLKNSAVCPNCRGKIKPN